MKNYLFIALLLSLTVLNSCTEEDGATPETASPTLLSIDPASGAKDVSVSTNITATFSASIEAATVNNGSFSLKASSENSSVSGAFTVSGSTVTFNPSTDLEYNTLYTLSASTAIEDQDGNSLKASSSTTFTTEEEPDTEEPEEESDTQGPMVVSTNPADDAIDVSLDANIVVTFSESIDLSSVGNSTIQLTTPAFSNNIQAQVNLTGSVMTIDPTVAMEESSVYTLVLGSGLKDLEGNTMGEDFEISFTTETVSVPLTIVSTYPESDATDIEIDDKTITVTFSAAIDASTVNSVSFSVVQGVPGSPIGIAMPGSREVNGSSISFTATGSFTEFNTEYRFYVSDAITDMNGNAMETSGETFKFNTVKVSEEYYYYIKNSEDNTLLSYNIGGGYIFPVGNTVGTPQQMWKFTQLGERYSITNKYVGTEKFLGPTSPLTSDVVMTTPPTPGTPTGPQRWYFDHVNNNSYTLGLATGTGTILFSNATYKFDYSATAEASNQFKFERLAKID